MLANTISEAGHCRCMTGGAAADAFSTVATEQRGLSSGRVQSSTHQGTVRPTAQRPAGWSQFGCVYQQRHQATATTATLPAVDHLPADRTRHSAAFHCLPACSPALDHPPTVCPNKKTPLSICHYFQHSSIFFFTTLAEIISDTICRYYCTFYHINFRCSEAAQY